MNYSIALVDGMMLVAALYGGGEATPHVGLSCPDNHHQASWEHLLLGGSLSPEAPLQGGHGSPL